MHPADLLIETYQQARRGFGGIFGRLQRGRYGTMRSTEFKNIMNMDENIDMIGRVDSNIHGSLYYYRILHGRRNLLYRLRKKILHQMHFQVGNIIHWALSFKIQASNLLLGE